MVMVVVVVVVVCVPGVMFPLHALLLPRTLAHTTTMRSYERSRVVGAAVIVVVVRVLVLGGRPTPTAPSNTFALVVVVRISRMLLLCTGSSCCRCVTADIVGAGSILRVG